ncbi:hypothetical protein D3C72_1684220 [compost metagenome]
MQQLHAVPGADGAGVRDVLRKAGQQRLAFLEQGRVAAHQQVQPALGGFLWRARHRRIQETAAAVGHRLRDLDGGRGDGGRAVDDDRAGTQAFQHAAGRQQHGLDLRAARHAKNDHIGLGGQRRAAVHAGRAGGLQRIQGLIARMLKHGQRMTMLDQIACNAVAHEADTNHADFRHLPLLLPCRVIVVP